ncbi:MAG: T9SS type A sorting domain-containing protein [Saprospiraceae bacterium]|nr:T9SS type A sorting domain-containing protein [Saprospiraceae bacterium]
MTIDRKYVLILVSAFWALTSFGQYFSRTFYNNSEGGSAFMQLGLIESEAIVGLSNEICSDNESCVSFLITNKTGDSINNIERLGFLGFRNAMQVRNDTIFFSDATISSESVVYWHFGMLRKNGSVIAEYKYNMIHLKDVGIGSFGYNYPKNYGLTLIGNNEVVLWGEGLDKRMPNPKKVPWRSAFLRLKIDGSRLSDIIWYEQNNYPLRRMADAAMDIDGNLVFSYEISDIMLTGFYRYVIKLNHDNTFTEIGRVKIRDFDSDFPRIVVDHDGNYIINRSYNEILFEYNSNSDRIPYITKMDREGNELWRKVVPPIYKKPFETIWTVVFSLDRLSIAANNDILCTGTCNICDSFYISKTNRLEKRCGPISFIARFDTDGNLIWRHFIAPQKPNGDLYLNGLRDIQEAPDGSIVVCGVLERINDQNILYTDAWLMRLSPGGCLNAECDHLEKYWHFPDSLVATVNTLIQDLIISPNPGTDQISITMSDDMTMPIRYELNNISSQRVEIGSHSGGSTLTISAANLDAGMYIIRLMDRLGKIWTGKWVKA